MICMKKMNLIIYAVSGVGAILFGVAVLLFQGALLSEAHRSFPMTHIFREEGAAAIFRVALGIRESGVVLFRP